jgi:hypothetical protein
VLTGTVKTARRPVPRNLLATVVQLPLTRSSRSTVAPGLVNGAAATRRSVFLPATSQNVRGGLTVTVITPLLALSGPSSRNCSVAVGGRTENLTRPSGPVTWLAACCHSDVPWARSSRRTVWPAAGWPS